MIIKTKQTTEHEIEITIPFFRKRIEHGFSEYLAMLTEGHVNTISQSEHSQMIGIQPKWVKEGDIVKAFREWEEITEEEFLNAHKSALSSLSLEPTLVSVPAADPNDIAQVNI